MYKKVSVLLSVGLLLGGCTKTIQINNRTATTATPNTYPSSPSNYPSNYPSSGVIHEEVVSYEPTTPPVQENSRVNYPTYPEPVREAEVSTQPVLHARADKINIRPLDASDMLMEGVNVMLLDVRMPEEIKTDGKIANSLLIPLDSLSHNLNRLDKSKEIIVYCHTGNRSIEAVKFLRSRGFNAINMLGGIEAWKRKHLNVVR